MAGSFDNEDNTLSDWAKEKVKKKLVQVLTKYGKRKKKVNTVSSEKYSYSLSRQSRETKPSRKLVLEILRVRNYWFVSKLTNPMNKMFMRLIYLKNSQSQNNY